MNKYRLVLTGVFTAYLLLISANSQAQFGGGMRGGREGMGRPDKMQRQHKEQSSPVPGRSAEYMFVLLKDLQQELALTPEQHGLWQPYIDKVMALADDISREGIKRQTITKMKVLQRLDYSVDVARNRLTALEDIADAAKKLYSSLTPDQQTIADPRLATLVQDIIVQVSFTNERVNREPNR